MSKRELMKEASGKAGITKKDAGNVIDAMAEAITNALSEAERATLVGFGSFQIVERKARRGRNPRTGGTIQIPTKKTPKFRAGKSLREKSEGR